MATEKDVKTISEGTSHWVVPSDLDPRSLELAGIPSGVLERASCAPRDPDAPEDQDD